MLCRQRRHRLSKSTLTAENKFFPLSVGSRTPQLAVASHVAMASPSERNAGVSAEGVGPAASAQQAFDDKIARGRAEHDCLKKLDQMMYCISARLRHGPPGMRAPHHRRPQAPVPAA